MYFVPNRGELMGDQEFDQCMRLMQNGEKKGLEKIYKAYASYIYAIFLNITKNRENSEDLTVDFFLKLWNISNQYKFGSGHKMWLTKVAKNMAIDFIRKNSRVELTDSVQDVPSRADNMESPIEEQVIGQISFREAVDLLPDTEQQILLMKFVGQMTFKEIAEILGIPMGTVTWKYRKSLEKLKCKIGG